MVLGYAVPLRNAQLDAITAFAGGSALLRFYSGTRPATGGTATTLLAELTCNATFAPNASGGVLTLNAVSQDSGANATGTATWFRIVKADGTTFVMDGSAGEAGSGADIILDEADIVSGGTVSLSSAAITMGNP